MVVHPKGDLFICSWTMWGSVIVVRNFTNLVLPISAKAFSLPRRVSSILTGLPSFINPSICLALKSISCWPVLNPILLFLVNVLAVVHDLGHGRLTVRINLN
ncbi:MAG: hypothetical protein UT75_C0003G0074 [Candidatus Yanofskybacteria bacterium GW2011_GWE2_40_11]|uniref:Uncharacterized protein n=1 Tax=Candidatus Yanofskybacteria bacterium GW2011_GWE2_40_11 TaxID=1619033 RepID=A0A0G0QKJ1_9BACT|nr:MAG: hypothetical protein UT75_C0003G0074 [Candidatus Yanofskybacteria bacterium GW2011_GWE2_40_11]